MNPLERSERLGEALLATTISRKADGFQPEVTGVTCLAAAHKPPSA